MNLIIKNTSTDSFVGSFKSTTPPSVLPSVPVGRPTPQELIATEEQIASLWNDGQLPFLTHLDGSADGSLEQFLCDFFHNNMKPTDYVLGSHRSHIIYQLHGGTDLVEQVKRGRSMFLHRENFLTSAIVAGVASIAVGIALAIKRQNRSEKVFVFCGDACSEHGHFMESVFYSHTRELPIQWVVLDNDSSCGVSKRERRGPVWAATPMVLPNVRYFSYPMKFPHAGTGQPMTLKRTTP